MARAPKLILLPIGLGGWPGGASPVSSMADSSLDELLLPADALKDPRRRPHIVPAPGIVALFGALLLALLMPRAPLTESRRAAAALGKTGEP